MKHQRIKPSKVDEILYSLKESTLRPIRTVRSYFRKIKRLIQFIPHVWRGYDWDYSYAIDLFAYQLERTAKALESSGAYGLGAENKAMRIRTTLRLMEKVYNEGYMDEWQDEVEAKYGPKHMHFEPTEEDPDLFSIEFRFEREYTAEELKAIKEDERRIMHKAIEKQKRAHKLLWQMVEHNIQGWWD